MNKEDYDKLCRQFDIKDIKIEEEIYNDYDIDWATIGSQKYSSSIIQRTKPVITIKADKSFMYFLLDFLSYKERFDSYEGMSYPNIEQLNKYFRDRYERWYTEEVLQRKYPELQDIMRDYEVTKALILESKK